VRLRVDGDLCQGHGRCYMLAPGLLDSDDQGFVTIAGSEIAVPSGQEALADELVGSCPEGAITLLDD
jgi:ferredoxin